MTAPTHHRDAVEVLGPWLMNKGDELMLRAVHERLGDRATLAVSTDLKADGIAGLPELPRIAWAPTAQDVRETVAARSLARAASNVKRAVAMPLTPRKLLLRKGLCPGRAVRAMLDCSGFAYGDQWNAERVVRRTRYFADLRRRGVKLVMLPQALGPFEKPDVREATQAMFACFDFVYAREAESLRHVLGCGVPAEKAAAVPDVSHLLTGPAPGPADAAAWAGRVAIVPNARMTDRTDPAVAGRYLDFLALSIAAVRERNLEPVILLHETNDDALLAELLERVPEKPRVVDEDGLTTKGILKCCYANIGSRYHSLVSSLSSATPTLGTSWAHKYDELFEEYGCAELLISPSLDDDDLRERMNAFLWDGTNAALRESLRAPAEAQADKVRAMWDHVEELIGGDLAARPRPREQAGAAS